MENIEEFINKDILLQKILTSLDNCKVYLVGGYVRDVFFGKISNDKDLIVENISAQKAAQEIANKLDGHFIELDKTNNIYRVVLSDKTTYVDIVNPVKNDINEDITRRDFTINALCYDVKNKLLIDNVNGLNDLKSKKIVPIDEKNFEDDPLRLLRAFRFQSVLGFELSENIYSACEKYSYLLKNCAIERINHEITALFSGKNAHNALISLDKAQLLEQFFPIVKEFKKIPPNSHHHLNLFLHSIETVKQIEMIYTNMPENIKLILDEKQLGEFSAHAYLKIAGFLHDTGKPQTWTIEPDTQRHRFIKHDEAGAEIVPEYLKKLKYSNKQIAYITALIRNHIYPSALVGSEDTTQKAKMRFFRKLEKNVPDVILLSQADRLSAKGKAITPKMISDNINGLNELLDLYMSVKNEIKPLPKLLDGREIMSILNIPQSPKLGAIISALKEEQLNGNIMDKNDAIQFIKEFYYTNFH